MQSSIKFRPKTLDELVGQDKLVRLLRGQYKEKTLPNAMMFLGPKGSGKTTTARIIALSMQCKHQDKFGNPCLACRKDRSKYPIYELPCGKVRGVEDVENFIETANYDIVGRGQRKVFLLDEAHRLSGTAQDVLLDPFEKRGKNLWMICTTRPDKIVETLRSRCQIYTLKTLDRDRTEILVKRILKRLHSKLSASDLADALVDNAISSGRLIANACDKYVAGESAEDAAEVEGAATINSKELIRATIKGDWVDTVKVLKKADSGNIRLLRASIISYLRAILFDSSELNDHNKAVADAIKRLSYVGQAEDSNQLAALSSELYTLCGMFKEYSR